MSACVASPFGTSYRAPRHRGLVCVSRRDVSFARTGSLAAAAGCAALLFFAGSVHGTSLRVMGNSWTRSSTTISGLFGRFDKKTQRTGWNASEGLPYGTAHKTGDVLEGAERRFSKSGYDITPLTARERTESISKLTDFQRYVAVDSGTERSFTGRTVNGYAYNTEETGVYVSAIGELPVFSSKAKFESGTGWPSFTAPIDPEHVIEVMDYSIPFMPRVEVIDARGGAHLGHVFEDGPAPTGRRFCLNAAALKFVPGEG